jgi:CRP-like cAMP-binding protein
LNEADASRLLSERWPLHWAPTGGSVSWEDGYPGPKLIVRGWACEARRLPDGRRQIYAFLLPGDICFPLGPRPSSRFSIVALTPIRLLSIGPAVGERQGDGLRELLQSAHAQNSERRYDTALRLGQLTSEERTLDLLLELCERLRALDLVRGDRFRLPLTQNHLADALGISEAHLNRTLLGLRRRRKLELRAGEVRLLGVNDPQVTPGTRGQAQGSRRSKRPR